MRDETPAETAIRDLLSTQLSVAGVYAYFLRLSSPGEEALWKKMLLDEVMHVDHLRDMLGTVPAVPLFPRINVARVDEACTRAIRVGGETFLLRLEWALRLECVELDYGLEGLAARRLEQSDLFPNLSLDIEKHMEVLLHTAKRYAASQNIGLHMRRLRELADTCLTGENIE